MGEGFTGYSCRGTSRLLGHRRRININGTGPIVGPFLAQFLQGGTRSAPTAPKFYAIHMLVIPGGIAALIGLHSTRDPLGVTRRRGRRKQPAVTRSRR